MTQGDAEDLYRNEYRPAWVLAYGASDLPSDLTIFPGPDFDGGAVEGMVFIYEGVLSASDEIVKFALAHEMSHVVQTRVGQRYGLSLPDTENEASRGKRSEYMADLIGYHTLFSNFSKDANEVAFTFPKLEQLLGSGDSMHPPGKDRVRRLIAYRRSVLLDRKTPAKNVLGELLKGVMT